MRIYTDNSEEMINNLAQTISRDPASMEAWLAIYVGIHDHIEGEILASTFLEATSGFQQDHANMDCDVVFCQDGDLLLMSKHLTLREMEGLATDMCIRLNLDTVPDLTRYDVFKDWRSIWEMLQSKVKEEPVSLSALLDDNAQKAMIPEKTIFGEVEALQEVFDEIRAKRPGRNPIHILLVEDDNVTRRLVSNVFKEDFAIITAENAEEAVTNYMLYAPDIVFLDIGLPDANGFDVLKQLVSFDPSAYVVMFSSNSYLENVVHAMTEGASGFIAKPFKKDKLKHYIHAYAEEHHKHVGA